MAEQDVKKTATPPMVPPVVANSEASGQTSCQWFLDEKAFCDKIKKGVRCDGDVRKCPF